MSERYRYQELLTNWGTASQEQLQNAHFVILGCGALGSNLADQLTRLGAGRLTLIDNDTVNISNLHRVALFTAADCGQPKVTAVARHLQEINPQINLTCQRLWADESNLAALIDGANILLDGSDNMATRSLINKFCHQKRLPWVYGGVLGTSGMILPIIPGRTACLNCLLPNLGQNYEPPTTAQLGILPTLPRLVAAYQVNAALQLLFGQIREQPPLLSLDLEQNQHDYINVRRLPDCPTCSH